MGFFCFFGAFPFGLGFAGGGLGFAIGRGRNGHLTGPFLLIIFFLLVDSASIFSMPKASQKLPISLRD